ncbi:uncharacterized protein LOC126689649 [Quercus robur]|uniref:uncharacterized protein LOC126689649 n=1 Tax=Quercus robur TaxID=38942 RepID=UPI0021623C17|nr:uncharacterized protein LOC126689649 [Quercus robur]
MNQSATEGKENTGAKRATEVRVDTVDYQSLAGGGQEQKNVQVIHQPNSSGNSTTSGGVLADAAAAALETTLQSARDAISRK